MEVRQMRYFLALAETLHFRQAAEMLHLSQPSLSQQIQQIEQELELSLFERTHRQVHLTAAGEALVPRVRALLKDMDEALAEARRVNQGLSGQLTIHFVSTALVGVLPKAMLAFQNSLPGVQLALRECDPREQVASLIQGDSGIGFMHATLEESSLSSMVIQRDQLIAALPESLAPEGPIDLCEYKEYASIMPSPFTAFGFYNHVHRAYQIAGVAPRKAIHTNLITSGIHLAAAGVGIALVPSSFESLRIPGVAYRRITVETPPVELLAVWKNDPEARLMQRFLTVLKSFAPEQ